MTLGSILLGLALLILVGLIVARPLFKPDPRRNKHKLSKYDALLAQKEALLVQIRSLDFDYDTGKVPERDYKDLRANYMAEATAVLKRLDELGVSQEVSEPAQALLEDDQVLEETISREIEAAVLSLRQSTQESNALSSKTAATDSAHAGNGKVKYCPQCGQPTDPEDKFCVNCGQQLRQPPLWTGGRSWSDQA